MIKCLLVGLGGFTGTIGRYLLGVVLAPVSTKFPWSTLLINFMGALLIGAISAVSVRPKILSPNLLLFLTVGICGGFTTFSTYSLETVKLLKEGRMFAGGMYAAGSVLLCLAGVMLGQALVTLLCSKS
ncbi:MAG: fluoride efflux transporter CrcB [Lachnospiraceae bacterium]